MVLGIVQEGERHMLEGKTFEEDRCLGKNPMQKTFMQVSFWKMNRTGFGF